VSFGFGNVMLESGLQVVTVVRRTYRREERIAGVNACKDKDVGQMMEEEMQCWRMDASWP
jgi:hypothetical protein